MNARELISQVEDLGITLRVVGDKLRVKAQLGIITPEIKAELASHKTEIMQVLAQPGSSPRVTRLYHVVVDTDGIHKGCIQPQAQQGEDVLQTTIDLRDTG